MKPTKHFALAALLLLAMAVVLGTPAAATAFGGKASVPLRPPVGGPFPNASGGLSLTQASPDWEVSWLDRVSVSGLAPNTSYYMPLFVEDDVSGQWFFTSLQFQTDPRGNWKGSPGWLVETAHLTWGGLVFHPFEVYDSSTGTLVLTSRP